VEAAWRIVDPILGLNEPVLEYAPGTWGPPESEKVIAGAETWHDPQPEKPPA
jgi:glucose-6-phosphate 1-dehydrogenase